MNETIIKMWNEGKSGLEIGEFLGVTRNVVIGRITRLREKGVVLRQSDKSADAKKAIKQRTEIREKRTRIGWVKQVEHIPFNPSGTGVKIMDLEPGCCKYVVGNDSEQSALFCAEPIKDRSYCDAHYRLCYIPPKTLISTMNPAVGSTLPVAFV